MAEKKTAAAPTEERVKVKIPRAPAGESDTVFVGLNGKNYLIKRGVEVEVPVGVAKILEYSEQAKDALAAWEEANLDKQ